jgi:hypothetical protein
VANSRGTLTEGARVRIRKQISTGQGPKWVAVAEGTVLGTGVEKRSPLLNSFAPSPSGEYPLRRIRLRHDDGSISDLVIPREGDIEILPSASPDTEATRG